MEIDPQLSKLLTREQTNLLQATPSTREIRATWAVMGVLLLGCLATIPFAARQWPASHVLYAGAGIATFAQVTTGLLLISQAVMLRQSSALALGLAYSVGGLIILVNVLLAPNVATSLWFFRLWHGVFVSGVLVYAWLHLRNREAAPLDVFGRWVVRLFGLGLLFIAVLISYLVNKPFPLPPILHDGNYITIPDVAVNAVQLLVMVTAWILLVTTRRKTVLSVWMAVVACAVSIDIVLFVLGTTLFSVGLYISKLNNLLAGTLIFGVIFFRYIRIQGDLQRHRTALLQANRQLTQIALTDTLTELPNRAALDQHLQKALARAARSQTPLAVCLIDMDNFKPVNDQYGHEVGDQLLQAFAKRLAASLRQDEYFARLGGDEFVLVLEGLDDPAALPAVMERITAELAQPFVLSGSSVLRVTASIGVALFPDQRNSRSLLRAADQALYRVKAQKTARSQTWLVFEQEDAQVGAGRS